MSWHFSQALVAEYSEAICSGGDVSAPLNSTPTPEAYYWPAKTTGHSRLSRFGMTSAPLTASHGEALLMSYLAAFRARTSAKPEVVLESPDHAQASGRKWLGSLAKYDPDSSSWRTPQCSLLGGLELYSETWPRWGSMRNGECWERSIPAHLTSESASGLSPTPSGNWPTPTTADAFTDKLKSSQQKDGSMHSVNLSQAVRMWPTPASRDGKGARRPETMAATGRNPETNSLPDTVEFRGEDGRLNPEWVEWLMGWPIGWTALSALETARFREWSQQHGGT